MSIKGVLWKSNNRNAKKILYWIARKKYSIKTSLSSVQSESVRRYFIGKTLISNLNAIQTSRDSFNKRYNCQSDIVGVVLPKDHRSLCSSCSTMPLVLFALYVISSTRLYIILYFLVLCFLVTWTLTSFSSSRPMLAKSKEKSKMIHPFSTHGVKRFITFLYFFLFLSFAMKLYHLKSQRIPLRTLFSCSGNQYLVYIR